MDESETLKSTFARNSRWSGWSGQAIVAGLVLDIVVLLLFAADKSWKETAAGIFATFVIGAGVWLEIHFGHKAETAAVRLQQISDERIAQFGKETAEANARALEAQLALEKFRRPWALPVWKLPDWEKILSPFAGTPFRILTMNEPGTLLMAARLRQAFAWSRWTTLPSRGLPSPDEGVELIPEYDGIDIRVDQSRRDDWLAAAQAVAGIFNAEEIDAEARVMESGTPADAIHIFIGRKT